MQKDQATTVVSIASVLGQLLDHCGLDKIAIAKQAGIDMAIAYRPNDRVSTSMLQKVWKISLQQTQDECLGLTYATFIQPASLGGLGLSWITSDTLKDSINRLVRFQNSISTATDISLNELDDYYQIVVRSKIKHHVTVSMDAAVATLFQMCRITFGPELKVERVVIAHDQPENTEKFNEFFGVKVEFGGSETQLIFAKSTFEQQLVSANPDLARMSDKTVIEYLKKFDKSNLSLQVRARIIEELNNGVPNQGKIAGSLNMSLRNLQRKLKGEKTNFKTILDETRSELSKQYLRGSDRSIIEVGFLLGFSEPSNFARAFRRWTGVSPHEYRETPR